MMFLLLLQHVLQVAAAASFSSGTAKYSSYFFLVYPTFASCLLTYTYNNTISSIGFRHNRYELSQASPIKSTHTVIVMHLVDTSLQCHRFSGS